MEKRWAFVVALICGLAASGDAAAWGEIGHGAVGEVAERNLSPRARTFIFRILGAEPLAVSAAWPDQVRSDPRFKPFADYHFVTIPAGETYAKIPHPKKNMVTIVARAMKRLPRRDVSREEKMLLLRYLIHIVGDMHQPLHVGTPGYMGGNLCTVKIADPQTGIVSSENFHHVWDEVLIEYERREFLRKHAGDGKKPWFGYREYTDALVASDSFKEASVEIDRGGKVGTVDLGNWVTETARLGEAVFPKAADRPSGRRPYCKWLDPITNKFENGEFDEKEVSLLDEAYFAKWAPMMRSQILRGGFRLAKILDRIAGMAGVTSDEGRAETKFFKRIHGAETK